MLPAKLGTALFSVRLFGRTLALRPRHGQNREPACSRAEGPARRERSWGKLFTVR
jgi:hypothetical protein